MGRMLMAFCNEAGMTVTRWGCTPGDSMGMTYDT
jgi:hypothetical protein